MKRKILVSLLVFGVLLQSMVACGVEGTEESTVPSEQELSEDVGASEEKQETETSEEAPEHGNAQTEEITIAAEDIYEVLEEDGTTYLATKYGICRETEAGREWIYQKEVRQEGFVGITPQMQVYEGRLYLKTDITYTGDSLDWIDNGIRWIDLETLNTGILELDFGERLPGIQSFSVYNGFISLDVGALMEQTFLLPVPGKEVYKGMAVEELSDSERMEYGLETSRWLAENPGTLLNVSNRTTTENYVLLDLNMDGVVEQITLQQSEETESYGILDHHQLLLDGECVIEAYSASLHNTIWALSLDGKEILVVLYEDGPSDDPGTRFFRYEENTLVEVGGIGADIRRCEITEDGIITGVTRMDVLETSFVTMSWYMNENHRMEVVPGQICDFVGYEEREAVKLLEEITLYTEPGSSEAYTIMPQQVEFLQTTGDGRWIRLETADGQSGWIEVENYTLVELGKKSWEVFEGLFFAG